MAADPSNELTVDKSTLFYCRVFSFGMPISEFYCKVCDKDLGDIPPDICDQCGIMLKRSGPRERTIVEFIPVIHGLMVGVYQLTADT